MEKERITYEVEKLKEVVKETKLKCSDEKILEEALKNIRFLKVERALINIREKIYEIYEEKNKKAIDGFVRANEYYKFVEPSKFAPSNNVQSNNNNIRMATDRQKAFIRDKIGYNGDVNSITFDEAKKMIGDFIEKSDRGEN